MADPIEESIQGEDPSSIESHRKDAEDIDFGVHNPKPRGDVQKETQQENVKEGSEDPQEDLLGSIGFNGKPKEGEEKPSEESPTDDDYGEPPKESANRANWDKLKRHKEEAVAKVQRLEAELAERPDTAAAETLRARVKELEQQNAQFSAKLKEHDFKSHPEYFEKYEKPIKDAQERLKEIAAREEVEVNVEALSALTGKQYAEEVSGILDQLTKFSADEFSENARQLQRTIGERNSVAENADQFIQEANERFNAETRAIFDEVTTSYSETMSPLEVPDNAGDEVKGEVEAYNAALGETARVAEAIAFGQMDNRQIAQIANEAAQYRFLIEHGLPRLANNAGAKIAELTKELNAIKEAGPQYTPRKGSSKGGDYPMAELGHKEAAAMAFSS